MSTEIVPLQPSKIFSRNAKVISFLARIDCLQEPVFEAETRFVKLAVTSRKNEFSAGRNIARKCLAEFGRSDAVIPVLESRAPAWPEGFIGSISHSGEIVGAAVCRKSDYQAVGLDIEKSCAVTPELFDFVLSHDDLECIAGVPNASLATRVFCCKEAVYKAVSPVANEFLDFADLSIKVNGNSFTAECDPSKASSQLIVTGRGYLEYEAGFVRALFLVR